MQTDSVTPTNSMESICDFPRQFYHGSPEKFTQFEYRRCAPNPIFGPGIYLTQEHEVACCYYRPGGAIYWVEVDADPRYTINLETTMADQSDEARLRIQFLLGEAGKQMPPQTTKAWDALNSVLDVMTLNQRNFRLGALGVWMIYGHMPASCHSGRCDNGVHYVLLRESTVSSLAPINI